MAAAFFDHSEPAQVSLHLNVRPSSLRPHSLYRLTLFACFSGPHRPCTFPVMYKTVNARRLQCFSFNSQSKAAGSRQSMGLPFRNSLLSHVIKLAKQVSALALKHEHQPGSPAQSLLPGTGVGGGPSQHNAMRWDDVRGQQTDQQTVRFVSAPRRPRYAHRWARCGVAPWDKVAQMSHDLIAKSRCRGLFLLQQVTTLLRPTRTTTTTIMTITMITTTTTTRFD